MSAAANGLPITNNQITSNAAVLTLKVLHAVIKFPEVVFLGTLTAMLFRPPDLKAPR